MGFHYVPERYLRNFEDPTRPGYIWMYDRKTKTSRLPAIRAVAQEADFYDDAVEVQLANQVEAPANPVIDKLSLGETITSQEHEALAVYIGVMMKRVPYRREKGLEMMPAVLDKTIGNVREQLEAALGNPSINQDLLSQRLSELDAVHEKYRVRPPPEIFARLRTPWATQQMIELIHDMCWRVVNSSGPSLFLTSDNPAFFFGAYGLGTAESEVTFPLSPNRALHACWQGPIGALRFLEGKQLLVKEVNRRIASSTSRFAFYPEEASWIQRLLQQTSPKLNRIMW